MTDINRPHAVTDGGPNGIGLTTARRLMQPGVEPILLGHRTDPLAAASEALEPEGPVQTTSVEL